MNKKTKKSIVKKLEIVNPILFIVSMLLLILPPLIFLICLSISGITLGRIYLLDWYSDLFWDNNPVYLLSVCWGIFLLMLDTIIRGIKWCFK